MSTIKGRYRVVETLETSADAVVYVADDLTSDRQVLLTVLREEAAADADFVAAVRDQVYRLAKPANAHRAVLAVYECDVTDEGEVFVALEAAAGRSLREMLNERGALDPSSTLRLAVQIGEALETLHRNGIVHGALRPESVLIVKDEDGTEAVKLRGLELASARWTAAGVRLRDDALSPYLAPEQIEHAETSETADVHALGLLVQELLTAERPRGTGLRLRPAGELPMMMGRIVAKALESRPERRYANVSLMVNDLWSAESERPKSDSPSVTHVLNERRATARRRARSDIGMAIALVVGLVLVGVTAWVVRSDRLTGPVRTESAEPPIAASPGETPAPPPSVNAVSVQPLRPPTPATVTEDAVAANPDATGREPTAAPPARPVAKTSPAAALPASVDQRGADGDGSAIIDWLLKGRRTGH